jgi:signal transduction histidine kinase
MSLGNKTLLGLSAAFGALGLLLYALLAAVLRADYSRLEERELATACGRLRAEVGHELEVIAVKAADLAANDETYEFAAGGAAEFAQRSLGAEALRQLQLQFIVVVDAAGKVVADRWLDLESGTLGPMPADLAALLAPDGRLVHAAAAAAQKGLLAAGQDGVLVCARPILRSDRSGPGRGVIVVGRELAAVAATIASCTGLRFSFSPAPGAAVQDTMHAVDGGRTAGQMVFAGPDGAGQVRASFVVDREITALGEATLDRLAWALGGGGAICALVAWLAVRRLAIRRLAAMRDAVARIARTGDLHTQLDAAGGDEIADLARSFNAITAQLSATHAELVGLNRARGEFLASVSHEIRTPMTAVIGFADLLLHPDIGPERRIDYVQTIRRNGQHLLAMLNDLLDFSKIEAGQMKVEKIACDLPQLLADVLNLMRPAAIGKHLSLTVEQRGDVPVTVLSDPTRLKQILINLVGNAIKFTEVGGIRIAVEVTADRQLAFAVTDTGIGIAKPQLDKLFAAFMQAESSTARRFGGTGLGLTLSRRLARLLGGDVTATSTVDEGSTFRLEIAPGRLDGVACTADLMAAAKARHSEQGSSDSESLHGARVLVADDAPDNQRLVSFLLRKAGASVEIVGDGQMAADRILAEQHRGQPYDIVLMDMQMPVLDGYSATEVRASGYRGPIVALTANAMAGDKEHCIRAGCTDYLSKPIEPRLLIGTVAKHTAGRPRRADATEESD